VLLTSKLSEDPMADERQWSVYPEKLPDRANALRFNIDACVSLARQRQVPDGPQAWRSRREEVAAQLRRALAFDPPPAKAPLAPTITGRCDHGSYTVENLRFQSQPHFYVTANVYVPTEGKRPLPAIVVTAGHAMQQGKNYDLYRMAQLGLVRQGFLVLAYDPLGQGERQIPGNSHDLSYAALLTGKSNLHYMVWDSIRAVDYLLTRSDVDPRRIGLTGNSGGGLNTMYTMPVEPRLAAGATFCCLCSFEAWIGDGGNHCICNHLPGVCPQFEQFEFVGLCASRPFLTGNGALDSSFPVVGARKTIERAARIYAFENAADRVALREAPLPHGWSQPLREAAYGWFARWLQSRGDGSPLPEPALELGDWQSPDLRVLKDGKLPDGAKSYAELIREEAESLVARLPRAPVEASARIAWAAQRRRALWQVLGGKPKQRNPAATRCGEFGWKGHKVERLTLTTEDRLDVPALLIRPSTTAARLPAVVWLDADGKQSVRGSKLAAMVISRGVALLAVDVRGVGEGVVPENQCASDAITLGRPMLAQQTWDVICAARYLAGHKDIDSRRIAVYGRGSTGILAATAAALDESISAVVSEGAFASYLDTIAAPLPQPRWVYAPNLLRAADVPDLLTLCSPRPVLWVNPTGCDGHRPREERLRALLDRVDAAATVIPCLADAPEERVAEFIHGRRPPGSK